MFGILRKKKYGVYIVNSDKSVAGELKRAVRSLHNEFGVTGFCADVKKAADKIAGAKPDMIVYEWKHGHAWFMDEIRAEGLLDCAFVCLLEYPSGTDARDFFASGGFDCWVVPYCGRDVKRTLAAFADKRTNGEDLIPLRAEYPRLKRR